MRADPIQGAAIHNKSTTSLAMHKKNVPEKKACKWFHMEIICVVENDIIHYLVVTGQKLIVSIMTVIMNVHAQHLFNWVKT